MRKRSRARFVRARHARARHARARHARSQLCARKSVKNHDPSEIPLSSALSENVCRQKTSPVSGVREMEKKPETRVARWFVY
jgi:hypothetical protein